MRMRIDDSWNSRWLSALSSILIDFEPIQILMSFLYRAVISSQLSSNSRATLVLVWPGHESWENSHANSRFSTLINSHATLVLVWPGQESWENAHTNSRFSNLVIYRSREAIRYDLRFQSNDKKPTSQSGSSGSSSSPGRGVAPSSVRSSSGPYPMMSHGSK
jgi:hypothetical protein